MSKSQIRSHRKVFKPLSQISNQIKIFHENQCGNNFSREIDIAIIYALYSIYIGSLYFKSNRQNVFI